MNASPDRILIVKLGSIGDAVNTLPLVNVLKEASPDRRLAWLIEPKSFPIVKNCRAVDRFIVFERRRKIQGALGALREIRDFRPELVIDLQRILRSSFFTFLSGSPLRLGFDRVRCKEGSWLFTNRRIPPRDPKRHMVLQYLEFAEYLEAELTDIRFDLSIDVEDRSTARRILPGAFSRSRPIALNIGATKEANRWPVSHWSGLIEILLAETSSPLVLTGGPDDRVRGEELVSAASDRNRIFNSAGLTSLGELGGIFLECCLAVSGDTGPMHIASALGIPTVGLFGPADPRRTGPFRHLDMVIESPLECSPCGRRRCRPNRCMEEIAPEDVWERIRDLILGDEPDVPEREGSAGEEGKRESEIS